MRIGADFSPCMRYIASGSEDHTVHMFDVRMGSTMCVMRGKQRSVVADVAWSPVASILCSVTYDGKLHFWGEGDGD